MRTLYFALWFLLSIFFSSPNLSRRRFDVYHASTHGVALVRIWTAGLKHAARGSLKYRTQKIAKNSPSGHHRRTLSGYRPIFATKARIDNRKQLLKQQYLTHTSLQYGELKQHSHCAQRCSNRLHCNQRQHSHRKQRRAALRSIADKIRNESD